MKSWWGMSKLARGVGELENSQGFEKVFGCWRCSLCFSSTQGNGAHTSLGGQYQATMQSQAEHLCTIRVMYTFQSVVEQSKWRNLVYS